MLRYLGKRILFLIPILLAVSTLVFFLIHFVPGDPVDLILGEQALPADREAFRQALRLDRPVGEQYLHFLTGLVSGDWGNSLFDRRPVAALLLERYPATLELAFCSMGIALLISLSLGVVAAIRKGSVWDYGSMMGALLGISIPHFWLGPLLVLAFSIQLDLLPVSGRDDPGSFLLPAITLGSGMAAILTRMTRSSMLETLREDYVRTARAKGVPEFRVVMRHTLRNALHPVVTIVGLQFGALLAGAIVTEKIFAWPGIGSLLVQSIERRDYPVVQGCILCIAFSYSLINLLTDFLYARLDPRIRLEEKGG
jgi:peptide/nickel transport system permease protein